MKKAQKDLKKQAWKGSKKPDEDAHEEDAAPAKRLRKKTPTRPSMTAGLKDTASKAAQSDEADVATDQKSQTSQDAQERKQRATKDEPERSKGKSAKGESSKSKSMSQVSGSSKTEAKTDKVGKDKRQTDKPKKEKRKSRKQEHPTAEDEADKSKDQKQKRDRQSEPASEKLRGRPAVEDFEACLREFEDSAEEPAPPKSRKLAPTSSGPEEIDEEDMWWELELFRNRNYELREEADWDADQGWDQWDGDAVEGWGGGEQEWLEDGQGESEVVADSNRKRLQLWARRSTSKTSMGFCASLPDTSPRILWSTCFPGSEKTMSQNTASSVRTAVAKSRKMMTERDPQAIAPCPRTPKSNPQKRETQQQTRSTPQTTAKSGTNWTELPRTELTPTPHWPRCGTPRLRPGTRSCGSSSTVKV